MLTLFPLSLLTLLLIPSVLSAPVPVHQTGDQHVVLLDPNNPATPDITTLLASLGLSKDHEDVTHIYDNAAYRGFAARMTSHCLDILANTNGVRHVEPSVRVMAASTHLHEVSGSTWGLQRLSSPHFSIDKAFETEMKFTYTYANNLLGRGADVYILDGGLFTQHEAFGGRAKMGWSFDGVGGDTGGHGTHVAGIAAGKRVGVAQAANIIGVKVLGEDGGNLADIVKGTDLSRHQPNRVR